MSDSENDIYSSSNESELKEVTINKKLNKHLDKINKNRIKSKLIIYIGFSDCRQKKVN